MRVNEVELADGRTWQVVSSGAAAPLICIPINQLDGLSTAAIGEAVLRCIPDARRCRAYHFVDESGYLLRNPRAEDILEYESLLEGFEDDPYVADAYQHLQEEKVRLQKRYAKAIASAPKPGYVYVLIEPDQQWYKIGRAKDVTQRLKSIELPFKVVVLHTIPVTDMVWAERYLHQRFATKRLNGEWFNLDSDDVAYICSLTELEAEV